MSNELTGDLRGGVQRRLKGGVRSRAVEHEVLKRHLLGGPVRVVKQEDAVAARPPLVVLPRVVPHARGVGVAGVSHGHRNAKRALGPAGKEGCALDTREAGRATHVPCADPMRETLIPIEDSRAARKGWI